MSAYIRTLQTPTHIPASDILQSQLKHSPLVHVPDPESICVWIHADFWCIAECKHQSEYYFSLAWLVFPCIFDM